MGGWSLTRKVDENDSFSYKFTPKYVLKANNSVVVSTGHTIQGALVNFNALFCVRIAAT